MPPLPSRLAVSCDVANVHRVLDTIVRHVECTEEGSEEAAVEAEFAPLDVVRARVVKCVQTCSSSSDHLCHCRLRDRK